jgi:hypothetical protein
MNAVSAIKEALKKEAVPRVTLFAITTSMPSMHAYALRQIYLQT